MQDYVAPHQRRWANREIAREVDHERARWLWGVFVAMLLAAAPFAAYLLEQNECLRLSYKASALRQQREQLLEQERRLRMQRASLESLDKIESWAVGRHGLVHPSPEQVVVVRRAPPGSAEPPAVDRAVD
jgi:cell division protein FtsL